MRLHWAFLLVEGAHAWPSWGNMAQKTECYTAAGPAGLTLVQCTSSGRNAHACTECLKAFNATMNTECQLPDVRAELTKTATDKIHGTCEQAWHSMECAEKLQEAASAFTTCAQSAVSSGPDTCDKCAKEFSASMEPCEDHPETMKKADSLVTHATDKCKSASGTGRCTIVLKEATAELKTCTETAVKTIDAEACAACTESFYGSLGDCKETFQQTAERAAGMAKSTCKAVMDEADVHDHSAVAKDEEDDGAGPSIFGEPIKYVTIFMGFLGVIVMCIQVTRRRVSASDAQDHASSGAEALE